MRKDIKTGMLAGTVLCFVAIVWFCVKQEVISQPLMKVESHLKKTRTSEADNNNALSHPAEQAKDPQVQTYEPAVKTEASETAIIHTVTAGQTLSDISKIYYNTGSGWKKIYEANKEQFSKGPDIIRPGMRLIIPQ